MPDPTGFAQRLFVSFDFDAFRDRMWPGRLAIDHGPVSRFQDLAGCPDLQDAAALLRRSPPSVRLWCADRGVRALAVSPQTAEVLSRLDCFSIQAQGVDQVIPAVRNAQQDLLATLAAPVERAYCNAYVAPAGSGTPPHFDGHEVLIVQLRGRKRWSIAENRHVRWPAFGFECGDGELGPVERAQLRAPLPDSGFAPDREIVLEPGSVLYLPRGWWHRTEALETSLSLTFTFHSTTWLQLLTRVLREGLIQEEQWREAVGALGIRDGGEHGGDPPANRFNELLRSLGNDLVQKNPNALSAFLAAVSDPAGHLSGAKSRAG